MLQSPNGLYKAEKITLGCPMLDENHWKEVNQPPVASMAVALHAF